MIRPSWDDMRAACPPAPTTPCIELDKPKRANGYYGRTTYGVGGGVRDYPHRIAFRKQFGDIPSGYEVDHLCNNTSCVNPLHLEAVTPAENKKRAGWRQVACKNGHTRTNETAGVVLRGDGRMEVYCRVCSRGRKTNI